MKTIRLHLLLHRLLVATLALAGAGLSSSLVAQSTTTTWTGADGAWGTATNWSNGAPSTSGSNRPVFSGQGANAITGANVNGIGGASFTEGSYVITFSAPGKVTSGLSVSSGTQSFNGVAASVTLGQSWTVASGATLNFANNLALVSSLTLTGAGQVNITGNVSGSSGLGRSGGGTTILSGSNTNTGNTVTSGTLLYNGTLSGAGTGVTVNSGGTLGGTGTINRATTINSGGTLAPGASPGVLSFGGALTLASGSTTAFEINGTTRGTGYDGINNTGLTNYGGTLALNFGNSFSSDGTFDLFQLTGGAGVSSFNFVTAVGNYTGNFTNDSGAWTLISGGKSLTFSQSSGDLVISSVSAIPEPATSAALVGLTALAGLAWRRRGKPLAAAR